ncbi:amylo-alpha-1,6-glucosidase [Rhodomicrobium sp. Az07]|uniref:amylo-alpha-1,6-glucosidase n=1 Tax=Rhodomicrobium sp. Az07 TaxID=2839034 RepID=UPI001BEA2B65|nr:amylo-alpha-1,6-glucosidase [Rhodomicrobium sp. Az07]MBT3069315.1 amylo-alpha-1,6-glucosidase [Rhodomicrobium sp. Az07]
MLDEPKEPSVCDTIPESEQSPFYIASAGAPSRPRCILKQNDCFVVMDNYGDIGCASDEASGLYSRDTRHLSKLMCCVNGEMPLLLGSTTRDDNLNMRADLTNPDIHFDGQGIEILKDTVHIKRTIYLHNGGLAQRNAFYNHGAEPVSLDLDFHFDADFADLFEVRGMRRPARGSLKKEVVGKDKVKLQYTGLDGKVRETTLTFQPTPVELTETTARFKVALAPRETERLYVAIRCDGDVQPAADSFLWGLFHARRDLVGKPGEIASVETSNAVVNEIICRSLADLRMLMTKTTDGKYPYAGIPWYSTTFGRDGLITAMQLLWFDPSVARGVLKRLARFQATTFDDAADAQPGKILHEMRGGEMAALGEVPFGLYYGSVDSTPLFVLLAGLYVARTGDIAFLREIWPNVLAALDWIDGPGDPDGDGFVEYARANQNGLVNQGWKDSHDAVFHADGSLAEGSIALVEVQGYVYAALKVAGNCAKLLGEIERADTLIAKAELLRLRFEAAFWCDDLRTYALALDGKKRPCRVRTSNAAQAMATGIMMPERARQVAHDLLRPRFNSGWGIRTVASGEARYNPMSYHNGSIWPHDNAIIAIGLARYGLTQGIAPIFEGLMQAASYMDQRRLPELFCGFPRRRSRGPTLYPVACSPQAWASGAVFQLLQAVLGLHYSLPNRTITLRNPVVPMSIGEIAIRNMRLGDASISFTVRPERSGNVSVGVLERTGKINIAVLLDEGDGAAA